MSMTATSRRGSVTCIFEDLERKAQVNVNTDKPDMTALPISTPTKIIVEKNPPGIIPVHSGQFQDESSHSSAVSTVSIDEMCKICHCGGESGNNVSLIAPCYCSGSLKYVHQECLQRWIKSSDIKRCELCKYPFAMQAKVNELKIIVYHVLDTAVTKGYFYHERDAFFSSIDDRFAIGTIEYAFKRFHKTPIMVIS